MGFRSRASAMSSAPHRVVWSSARNGAAIHLPVATVDNDAMDDSASDDEQLAVAILDGQTPIVVDITAVGHGPVRVMLNGEAIYEGDPTGH